MELDRDIVCTFVVASANRTLFTEKRPILPVAGEQIAYAGSRYEVQSVSPQEPPLGESLDEAAPSLSALIRVQLAG